MFGTNDNNQINSPIEPIPGSQSTVTSDPNIPYQVKDVVEEPVIPLVEPTTPSGPTLKDVMKVLERIEERLARIEGIKEAGGLSG